MTLQIPNKLHRTAIGCPFLVSCIILVVFIFVIIFHESAFTVTITYSLYNVLNSHYPLIMPSHKHEFSRCLPYINNIQPGIPPSTQLAWVYSVYVQVQSPTGHWHVYQLTRNQTNQPLTSCGTMQCNAI